MFSTKIKVVMNMALVQGESDSLSRECVIKNRKSLEGISLMSAEDIMENFIRGTIVFKITATKEETVNKHKIGEDVIIGYEDPCVGSVSGESQQKMCKMRNVHMVFNYEDFHKRLTESEYNPLLWMSPIYVQIFYLYGCMNKKKGEKRNEIFILWWRKTETDIWNRWFEFYPYDDNEISPMKTESNY